MLQSTILISYGLVVRPRSILGGEVPRHFFLGRYVVKELSVFIDESGDYGEYEYHSPYYIISMAFHDQADGNKQKVIR